MRNIHFALFALFLVGCSTVVVENNQASHDTTGAQGQQTGIPAWMNIELKDVNSGESYKISDFEDKPVLLESFAVWCPTCTKQQKEIKKLHDEVGDDIISISLDTDPNEDEQRVLEHANANGFSWRYSVAPTALTRALIDEFGTGVVNAPAVPVVLICGDHFKYLKNGVKSPDFLKNEIAQECGA
ncbi:redoxin family protein [Candidatus Woesearchaeota archaeon]|nr:redoxin family protein [Candidatus Woesearchaeota archaeon]